MALSFYFLVSLLCLYVQIAVATISESPANNSAKITRFHVNLSQNVARMMSLVNSARLPETPQYPGLGASMGIDLDVMKSLKSDWLHKFNWEKEQRDMNRLQHYMTEIEGLKVHFIYQRSKDPNAIPLLISHGWPGSSFLEFEPILNALTKPVNISGSITSFHLVAPSLPGFAFSSPPPQNWTLDDTARVYNTLMTKVLGFSKFAVHGTAHGAAVAYTLYEDYNVTTRAAHFTFLPFFPPTAKDIAKTNITLTPLEKFMLERSDDWGKTGNAYYLLQLTKPNTIGLALYDSPLGQLAWIGEKYIEWSDPDAGKAPSQLTRNEILRCVSLYYLTKSFLSSIFTYAQNPMAFRHDYTKAPTTAPLLLSQFKYNVGFWPKEVAATVGNLVEFKNHENGGNFPGLDNPPALIADLRNIGKYWKESIARPM